MCILTLVFLSLTFKIKATGNMKGEAKTIQDGINKSIITISGFLSIFGFALFLILTALGIVKCFWDPSANDENFARVFTSIVNQKKI